MAIRLKFLILEVFPAFSLDVQLDLDEPFHLVLVCDWLFIRSSSPLDNQLVLVQPVLIQLVLVQLVLVKLVLVQLVLVQLVLVQLVQDQLILVH